MISKIGAISNINVLSRPSFKAEKENEGTVTKPDFELKTPEAVANYGIAAIKMAKKFDIKPLEPTIFHPNYTHSINGERIYTSAGRLHSITDENDKTKTIYSPNNEDERFFDKIETIDKETGKTIRKQISIMEDGKVEKLIVMSYSRETGDIEFETCYDDGELEYATKYINGKQDSEESITYYYGDKEYVWFKEVAGKKTKSHIRMSKDLKFVDLEETKTLKDKEIEIEASFYNGGLISLSEEKKITVPNLLGREPLNDKDLVPAEPFLANSITSDIEGEKTYYSNGAVESVIIPDGTLFFEPDGTLSKVISPTKEIEFETNGNQTIIEKIDENTTKTTEYRAKSKMILVKYENDNICKELRLNSDLKPRYYNEESKEDDSEISLWYNKQGFLESAYNF